MPWGLGGAVTAALVVILLSTTAPAQDAEVEELQRNLRERDKVIAELIDRVQALERRVGVRAAEPAPADAAPVAEAATAAEAPPGGVIVTEADAERALERSLTESGALLLPPGFLEVEPGITYSREEDDAATIAFIDRRFIFGTRDRERDTVTGNLEARLGLPGDAQLELGVPYRWRESEEVVRSSFSPAGARVSSGKGLGDVSVGLAKTLLREDLWQPDLVGRVTWDTDTGKDEDNGVSLGYGFHELTGSLSAIKRQDPLAFVGGLSYQHTFEENDVQPGPVYGGNIGTFLAVSPESSLRLVLSGAYQDDTEIFGSELDGSDQTVGSLIIGGSTLLAPGTLLNLSAGIGLTEDAEDLSVTLSVPIRLGGPLF